MTTSWTSPPARLTSALDAMLEGQARRELSARAARLSEGFRARMSSKELIRDESDALAYALTRLPATFAANATVLRNIFREVPQFSPSSLIDAGCGLASASFAALEVWPEIASVTLLDRSETFLTLARRLMRGDPRAALAEAEVVVKDLLALPPTDGPPADLVIASYALTEIEDAALPGVINALWERASGALALIEPGTPRDYARLMKARERLVGAGGRIALPCPHDRPCPLASPDWCHFSTRLARTRDHKLLKNADAPFEDEKFSYLVAFRDLEPARRRRIIAPPHPQKWGIELRLCSFEGIEQTTITKRDKDFFRNIRKAAWGDSVAGRDGVET